MTALTDWRGLSDQDLFLKLTRLKESLCQMRRVLIAYSGGVDSTFLLKVATDVLGENAIGVTAVSETYPGEEFRFAREVAEKWGFKQIIMETEELTSETFASNPPDRCYYCKTELFTKMVAMAEELGAHYVLDGANHDDLADYRPGLVAGARLGVQSPLKEAGLTKEEIRALSREMGLPTWDKPSFACLSSRFPYGSRITPEKLTQVDRAESYLRELGFRQLRVRHHDFIARIEIPQEEFQKFLDQEVLTGIVKRMKELGFIYITLDLQGFRSGSMNETLVQAGSEGDGDTRVTAASGRG